MSSRDVISEASTSAYAALSLEIFRVSESKETQKLKVERTSLLERGEREREREREREKERERERERYQYVLE